MMGTFKYFNSKLSTKVGHTSLPAIVPACETRGLSYEDDEIDGSLSALKPPPQSYDSSDYVSEKSRKTHMRQYVPICA